VKEPLYRALAGLVGAYRRCGEGSEWRERHRARIEYLVRNYMPSGSGFDNGTKIDLDASTSEKLVFDTSFHRMGESGVYDGWTDHRVIVTASLQSAFKLKISGRDRVDFKSYAYEVFDGALRVEVDPYGGEEEKKVS
jgi:hypothetical protein